MYLPFAAIKFEVRTSFSFAETLKDSPVVELIAKFFV